MAKKASTRKKSKNKSRRVVPKKIRASSRVRPSKAMIAELHQVVARHGWRGAPALVRPLPAATAAINCPPGQCPSMVSVPGPGGTIINVPICVPC